MLFAIHFWSKILDLHPVGVNRTKSSVDSDTTCN